jgi:antitoxin CptB
MKNINYKNQLIKKLKYRSIYSGSKESDFILSKFANNNLDNLDVIELESYEKFLTLGDVNIWNWVSGNEPLPFFDDQNYKKIYYAYERK